MKKSNWEENKVVEQKMEVSGFTDQIKSYIQHKLENKKRELQIFETKA